MPGIGKYKKGAKFTLKSGNSPLFKHMGSSPMKMYGKKSPAKADLVGNQKNLPEELKAKIKASPARKMDVLIDGKNIGTGPKARGKAIEKAMGLEEDMSVSELLEMEIVDENITEAKYKGKTVKLNKPMRGDSKKFKVYVNSGKKNADGSIKVKKVNFGHGGTTAKKAGQKTMKIRKSNPKARAALRNRHRCDNPGPKTMARYWSCKKW